MHKFYFLTDQKKLRACFGTCPFFTSAVLLVWIPHLLPALIILRRLRVNEKGRESVVEVNQNAALYGLQFLSNQIAYNHCFEFIFILCVYFFSFVLNQNRLFFF